MKFLGDWSHNIIHLSQEPLDFYSVYFSFLPFNFLFSTSGFAILFSGLSIRHSFPPNLKNLIFRLKEEIITDEEDLLMAKDNMLQGKRNFYANDGSASK